MAAALPDRLLEEIRRLASREFQARAWFGDGPEVSSLEEMYCILFDDLQIESYRETFPSIGTVIDAMDVASPALPIDDRGFSVPTAVIDHPAWAAVREVAAAFIAACERG